MEEQELIPAGAGVHRGTPMEYSTFKAEKWEFRGDVGKKKTLPWEGGEAVEENSQRICGCLIPKSVQGLLEQPGLDLDEF